MKENLKVYSNQKAIPIIDKNGNVNKNSNVYKRYLANRGIAVTKEYYYIDHLYDDYYAVLDVVSTQSVFEDELDDAKVLYKWGVICLKRDKNGKIIRFEEELVVPFLYDRICPDNLETLTAYADENHLTYIELDKKSPYYGEQLVPAVLTRAVAFNVTYKGFAECMVDGVIGYIPRNITPLTTITKDDLLTREQVEYLISINTADYNKLVEKINHLTGSESLRLVRKP